MKKLLLTRGASLENYQQYFRFDIRHDNFNDDIFCSIKINKCTENTPYECFEVSKNNTKEEIRNIIRLLNSYLEGYEDDPLDIPTTRILERQEVG